MYLVPGGVPGLEVYLVPGGAWSWGVGVPGPGGCTWSPRVYLVLMGGPGPGGVPAQVFPPCEQNDRQVQKHYLALNFVCRR